MDTPPIKIFVSALCHDGAGNLLMAKRGEGARDNVGRWEFGGGTVEFGETFEEALVREMKEEFNAIPFNIKQLETRSFIGERSHWVGVFFVAEAKREEVKNMEPAVHEEIDWFTLDTLPKEMISGDREWVESRIGSIL